MMISPTQHIPTEPYVPQGVTTKVMGGLAQIEQKINIVPLKALVTLTLPLQGLATQVDSLGFTGMKIEAGDLIYVKQSTLEVNTNYKNPLKLNGQSCILVELKDVVLVEKQDKGSSDGQEKVSKSRRPARNSLEP